MPSPGARSQLGSGLGTNILTSDLGHEKGWAGCYWCPKPQSITLWLLLSCRAMPS